jgi:hypothetical protein
MVACRECYDRVRGVLRLIGPRLVRRDQVDRMWITAEPSVRWSRTLQQDPQSSRFLNAIQTTRAACGGEMTWPRNNC